MMLSSSEEGLLRWIEASQMVPSLLLPFAFTAVIPLHSQDFNSSRLSNRMCLHI